MTSLLEETREIELGEHRIRCTSLGPLDAPVSCINLHQNEWSSIDAGRRLAARRQARLHHFDAGGQRELTFSLEGRPVKFDPNRIFSAAGVRRTLEANNDSYPPAAQGAVKSFTSALLDHWALAEASLVVALHNTGDEYCIHSYAPGGQEAAFTGDLAIADDAHRHDFFYVTDRTMFCALAQRGFNAVLQADNTASDDGSLSIWCAAAGVPYVNIEARFGATEHQIRMLETVVAIFRQGE